MADSLLHYFERHPEIEGKCTKNAVIAVNPSCISKATGQKKSNIIYFKELGTDVKIIGDESVPKYRCMLRR